MLFTYVSIDVPPLSPVVLSAESILRFDGLFLLVTIFNITNVWETWIHNSPVVLSAESILRFDRLFSLLTIFNKTNAWET